MSKVLESDDARQGGPINTSQGVAYRRGCGRTQIGKPDMLALCASRSENLKKRMPKDGQSHLPPRRF